MKKVLFTIILFFVCIINVNALTLDSKNAIMINLNNDEVIMSKNENDDTSIASLTKIMTSYVAIKNIDDLNKKILITSEMLKGLKEANAAVVNLKVGTSYTYEDLLYGCLIASGADATRALTISIAGSEDKYVDLMNKEAKSMGLEKTVFKNTTGLDEEGQNSSVSDVAKLLKIAIKNKTFYKLFTTTSYTFSNKQITVYSTLHKTGTYYKLDVSNIIGAKTGYTYNAGKCLASIGYDKKNDIKYMLVTTNATISTKRAYHVEDAINTYKYYFDNYKFYNIYDKRTNIESIKVKYSKTKMEYISMDEDITYYSDKTFDKNKIEIKKSLPSYINPYEYKKGDKIGKVEFYYDSKLIKTYDVKLQNNIQGNLLYLILGIHGTLKEILIRICIVIFIVLLLIIKTNRKK